MKEWDNADSAAKSESKKQGGKDTRGQAGKNGASGGRPAAKTEELKWESRQCSVASKCQEQIRQPRDVRYQDHFAAGGMVRTNDGMRI